jgi:hypothetical protein
MHDPSNTYMHSPEQVDEFDKKKVKRRARIYIVQLKNRDYIRQLLEGNFEEDPELYDFYNYPRPLQFTHYDRDDGTPDEKLAARLFFHRECLRIRKETGVKIQEDETGGYKTPYYLLDARGDGK